MGPQAGGGAWFVFAARLIVRFPVFGTAITFNLSPGISNKRLRKVGWARLMTG
jgi:hypothetical protein